MGRGQLRQSRRRQLPLSTLLVYASERSLLESDLGLEFDASAAAVEPAEVLELTLGGGESLGCPGVLPVEVLLLPGVQTRAHVALSHRLVDRERLGGHALEGAGDAFGWGSGIGFA